MYVGPGKGKQTKKMMISVSHVHPTPPPFDLSPSVLSLMDFTLRAECRKLIVMDQMFGETKKKEKNFVEYLNVNPSGRWKLQFFRSDEGIKRVVNFIFKPGKRNQPTTIKKTKHNSALWSNEETSDSRSCTSLPPSHPPFYST